MSGPTILAIDPSLSRTACVLGRGTDLEMWTCQTEPRAKALTGRAQASDWFDRIDRIVESVLRPLNAPLDLVVIEGMVVGRTVGSNGAMWLHGILRRELRLWAAANKIAPVEIVDISPQGLKKYAAGDGKVRDKDVMQHRARDLGSPARNNDEADAWWLWHMAHTALTADRTENDLTLYRREALAAVDWPHPWPKPDKPKTNVRPRKPKATEAPLEVLA